MPGATTDTEPAQTVEVTGTVRFSGSMGSIETWATNDPRLTGTGTWDPTEGLPRKLSSPMRHPGHGTTESAPPWAG